MIKECVRLVEVGPRDGLQNEKRLYSVEERVNLINALSPCGFSEIEVGSFVSPKWVPQMANTGNVFRKIHKEPGVIYSALVPNERGLEEALDVGLKSISVFTAASETFTQKNINCTIVESMARFKGIIQKAKDHHLRVRGYVSCVISCPYEGAISPAAVSKVTQGLLEIGCDEVSLGDTIGKGVPETVSHLLDVILKKSPVSNLAIHCHDTYGNAIQNVLTALQYGIRTVDSSIGGLGGCPYAGPSAKGNVATEVVVRALKDHGYETAVPEEKLKKALSYLSSL
jgi:hydroxymethylglutaryl-CoA lyase